MALGLNAHLVYDSPQIRVNGSQTNAIITPGFRKTSRGPQDGAYPPEDRILYREFRLAARKLAKWPSYAFGARLRSLMYSV